MVTLLSLQLAISNITSKSNVGHSLELIFDFMQNDLQALSEAQQHQIVPQIVHILLVASATPEVSLTVQKVLQWMTQGPLMKDLSDKVVVSLFRGMKMDGRCARVALKYFSNVVVYIRPQRSVQFTNKLVPIIVKLFGNEEIVEELAASFENIWKVLGFYVSESQFRMMIAAVAPSLSCEASVQRAAADCIAKLCRYIPCCSMRQVFENIHDISMTTIVILRSGKVQCTNKVALMGCLQTFIKLLEILEHVAKRSARASNHYSLYHLYTSLIFDTLTNCFSMDDRNIRSTSLELLISLLSSYGNYCKHWHKEKVSHIIELLTDMLFESDQLISIRSSIIQVLTHLCSNFTIYFLTCFRKYLSLEYFFDLLHHQDYLIRGDAAIFLGTLVGSCINNHVNIVQAKFHNFPIEVSLEDNGGTITLSLKAKTNFSEREIYLAIFKKIHQILKQEENSMCIKMAIECCKCCLNSLLYTDFQDEFFLLFNQVLVVNDGYWSVKLEILDLFSTLDFDLIEFYNRTFRGNKTIGQLIIDDVVFHYLQDPNPKVRKKASKVMKQIMPVVHVQYDEMSASENIQRSNGFKTSLLKSFLSRSTLKEYNSRIRIYHPEEIDGVTYLWTKSLKEINRIRSDVNRLSGVLEMFIKLGKKYSSFDETCPFIVNYNKGLNCAGEPILSEFCLEIINNLFDILENSPLRPNLSLVTLLVQAIGLQVLFLEHVREEKKLVTEKLWYYFTDLLSIMTLTDFQTDRTSINRLRESLNQNIGSNTFEELRSSILQSIYFLAIFGEQSIVLKDLQRIVPLLEQQFNYDPRHTILCVQELFVSSFQRKTMYFDNHLPTDRLSLIMNTSNRSFPDILFPNIGNEMSMSQSSNYHSHSTLLSLQKGEKPKTKIRESMKKKELTKILELFQSIVITIKKSFRITHDKSQQTAVLFMLSRLVCIGVNFKRLDKDHSFLRYILQLIKKMDISEKDLVMYHVCDFVSLLLFTVKYHPDELKEDILLPTIMSGLSNSSWNTASLLHCFAPLMIRSIIHSHNKKAETKNESTYGEKLLELYLAHLQFAATLDSLTQLLQQIRKHPFLFERISMKILEYLVQKIELKIEMESKTIEDESLRNGSVDKIQHFLDSVAVQADQVLIRKIQEILSKQPSPIQLWIGLKILNLMNDTSFIEKGLQYGVNLLQSEKSTPILSRILFEIYAMISSGDIPSNGELMFHLYKELFRKEFIHLDMIINDSRFSVLEFSTLLRIILSLGNVLLKNNDVTSLLMESFHEPRQLHGVEVRNLTVYFALAKFHAPRIIDWRPVQFFWNYEFELENFKDKKFLDYAGLTDFVHSSLKNETLINLMRLTRFLKHLNLPPEVHLTLSDLFRKKMKRMSSLQRNIVNNFIGQNTLKFLEGKHEKSTQEERKLAQVIENIDDSSNIQSKDRLMLSCLDTYPFNQFTTPLLKTISAEKFQELIERTKFRSEIYVNLMMHRIHPFIVLENIKNGTLSKDFDAKKMEIMIHFLKIGDVEPTAYLLDSYHFVCKNFSSLPNDSEEIILAFLYEMICKEVTPTKPLLNLYFELFYLPPNSNDRQLLETVLHDLNEGNDIRSRITSINSRKILRKIGRKLLDKKKNEIFLFFRENELDSQSILHLTQLFLLFGCDNRNFQLLWDLFFDLYKHLGQSQSYDKIQTVVLECLVIMLQSTAWMFKGEKTEDNLLVDTSKSDKIINVVAKHLERPANVEKKLMKVDKVFVQAIAECFLQFIFEKLTNEKIASPSSLRDVMKGIALLMISNVELFAISKVVTFEKLYTYLKDDVFGHDWMVSYYVNKIRVISFNYLPQSLQKSYGKTFFKLIQKSNFWEEDFRLISDSSFLRKEIIPYLGANLSHLVKGEKICRKQYYQMDFLRHLVINYPETSTAKVNKNFNDCLIEMVSKENCSILILKKIYITFVEYFENYSLSHIERNVIEAVVDPESKRQTEFHQILKLMVLIIGMQTGEQKNQELDSTYHENVIMQLFQRMKETDGMEMQVFKETLPKLIFDYVGARMMPLLYGEYLRSSKTSQLIGKMLQIVKLTHLEIANAIETLHLKEPNIEAKWALSCLFLSCTSDKNDPMWNLLFQLNCSHQHIITQCYDSLKNQFLKWSAEKFPPETFHGYESKLP